jgi:hypothetical protein
MTKKKDKAKKPKQNQKRVHSWRMCPYGQHWVRTHPLHIPPSKKYPDGHVTTRHAHCARNPSGKDELYPDEIREISDQHFSSLKNKPCHLSLKFKNGNKYDDLIAGWVQYWNDVLEPDARLNQNLVKALIASESGFDPNKLANSKNSNSARGLTQITNETRKLLGGARGGLVEHLIQATKSDLNDPSTNICAGIRWLFEKRRLATSHLITPASWLDAIWEYKGTRGAPKKDVTKIKSIFDKLYEEYQKCRK